MEKSLRWAPDEESKGVEWLLSNNIHIQHKCHNNQDGRVKEENFNSQSMYP